MINPLPTCVKPPSAKTSFGALRSYASGRPAECGHDGKGHCGVDLYLPIGTPVFAVANGKVVASKDSGNVAGEFIWLEHGDWRSHYCHLKEGSRKVSTGQKVSAGQQIGQLGNSGIKTDAGHLHFGLSRRSGSGWVYYDPKPSLCGGGSTLLLVAAAYLAWRYLL
jgi:murein DD-endopeptidase MepM/ murein hydrolase activator NlpD